MRTRRLFPTSWFWANPQAGTDVTVITSAVAPPQRRLIMRTDELTLKSDRGAVRGVYIPGIVVVILLVLLVLAIL
ncbi:MAG: hypothetical protein OSA99_01850 [Acidimicrobiales bacterium]|nr:hypothetical protein [Acidimicrobiales bacterium]